MTTFVCVVEGKSLSAAARTRRLSLPAVSRQLRSLEAELGASLIIRSTRRLHVTDIGQEWYQRCCRVLREIEEGKDATRSTKGAHGRLVVSASLTFGSQVIVPRLSKLAEQHPHLVIYLRLEDHLTNLVAEGVDVAVRAGSPPPDSTAFVAHALFAMDRVLVAAPRWLRKHGSPGEPEQLLRHDCLLQVTTAGAVVPWALVPDGRPDLGKTIEVRGRLRSNAPSALLDLALDGAGIAYLPDWLVKEQIEQGTLRRVLPKWSSAPINAWLIHRAELRGSPRVRAFLDAMPKSSSEVPLRRKERR